MCCFMEICFLGQPDLLDLAPLTYCPGNKGLNASILGARLGKKAEEIKIRYIHFNLIPMCSV